MAKIDKKFNPPHVDIPSKWINRHNRQRLGGRLKRAIREAQMRAAFRGRGGDQACDGKRLGAGIALAGTLIGAHGA